MFLYHLQWAAKLKRSPHRQLRNPMTGKGVKFKSFRDQSSAQGLGGRKKDASEINYNHGTYELIGNLESEDLLGGSRSL